MGLAAVLILSVGMGKWVWADEGVPVAAPNIGDLSARGWFIEQEATIAKDPEAMGIYAVQKAVELMQDQNQTVDQQSDAYKKCFMTPRAMRWRGRFGCG